MSTVLFEVGPVDGAAARLWLGNSKGSVEAVRANPRQVPFVVEQPLLELVETLLDLWLEAAEGVEVFHWRSAVEVTSVEILTQQWRVLARLDDATLAALGVTWAPIEAHPFYDALVEAVVAALRQDERTADLGADVSARPPGEE